MGYKLLGFAVWQGGKWFVRRRYGRHLKVAAALLVGALVVGGAVRAGGSR